MATPKLRRAWPSAGAVSLVAAILLLLLVPAELIGEDFQAAAVKGLRLKKIQALLEAQDASVEIADDLARGILRESEKNALDPLLIVAVIQVESRFDHDATSPRGAQGLMQVRPIVVAELIEEGKISPHGNRNLKDPVVNVRVGVSYLAYLSEMFGDIKVALAAYNWGPTRIRKKIAAKQEIPLHYAKKVLTVQRLLEDRLTFNDTVPRHEDSTRSEATRLDLG